MATRTYRLLWLLPPLLLSLAVVASVMAWPHLPARMPIHWGISGEPTLLAPKGFAVAMLPAIMVWVGAILGLILWSATRMNEGPLPAWLPPTVIAATLGLFLVMHLALIATGLGWPVSFPMVTYVGMGLCLVGMGRIIRSMPANRAIGVRTPRTLSDPAAMERANRVAGRGLVVAGVLTALAAPLPGAWPFAVAIISVLSTTIMAGRAARGA